MRGRLMTMPHASNARSIKRAELTSSVGAGILGAGLGVLTALWVRPYALLILALGIAMHAWGMYDKHRLEAGERLWWSELLYWGCWVSLVALLVFLLAGQN
jgi:hypothetical protein